MTTMSDVQSTAAEILVDASSGLKFPKSPKWNGEKLLFVDIHDRCIKSADLNGVVRLIRPLPYLPSGMEILAQGKWAVCDAWRRRLVVWDEAGANLLADISGIATVCLTECIADSHGGIYVADAGFDFLDPSKDPVANGVIIYIDANGQSSVVAEHLSLPNSMVITQDLSMFVIAEALAHRLTAYQIEADGSLTNRQDWAQLGDDVRPDGICIDDDGAIWVAGSQHRVSRVRRHGNVDFEVTTERPAFAVTLGGPELKHLMICTSMNDDPVVTRQSPNASIEIAKVSIPGVQL